MTNERVDGETGHQQSRHHMVWWLISAHCGEYPSFKKIRLTNTVHIWKWISADWREFECESFLPNYSFSAEFIMTSISNLNRIRANLITDFNENRVNLVIMIMNLGFVDFDYKVLSNSYEMGRQSGMSKIKLQSQPTGQTRSTTISHPLIVHVHRVIMGLYIHRLWSISVLYFLFYFFSKCCPQNSKVTPNCYFYWKFFCPFYEVLRWKARNVWKLSHSLFGGDKSTIQPLVGIWRFDGALEGRAI